MSEVYRAAACPTCGSTRGRPVPCERCGTRSHGEGAPDACPSCLFESTQARRGGRFGRILSLGALGLRRAAPFVPVLYLAAVFVALAAPLRVSRRAAVEPAEPAPRSVEQARAVLAGPSVRPPELASAPTEREAALLAAPRLLAAALGPETRDPRELLERAERFSDAGFSLTIARTKLAAGVAGLGLDAPSRPSRILPVHFNGRVVGIRLEGFAPESLPAMMGLESGDIVTSINGVPIVSPDRGLEAYAASRSSGMAVAEIIRGTQRVVLAVTWPPS